MHRRVDRREPSGRAPGQVRGGSHRLGTRHQIREQVAGGRGKTEEGEPSDPRHQPRSCEHESDGDSENGNRSRKIAKRQGVRMASGNLTAPSTIVVVLTGKG